MTFITTFKITAKEKKIEKALKKVKTFQSNSWT